MKIAQVAPLYEAVPPKAYGGTERVVAYLTDELVDLGYDVTLFASGESKTKAKLISCRDEAIRLDQRPLKSDIAAHLSMLHEVRRRAHEFDVIHMHVDLLFFPFLEAFADRTLTTLHGRLDIVDLAECFRCWPEFPLVSISNDQRRPLSFANWEATVYHGLPVNLYRPPVRPTGGYLAFLGRLSPEKQPHVAIEIAKKAQQRLKIAAKIETLDLQYYREQVEPLLADRWVDYLGEMADDHKSEFLGNADALLLPINWPEPFGIVMIEAMACGTPVIAFDCGSVSELIEHGVTGFIVKDVDEAVQAIGRLHTLDRKRIRAEFERRFTSTVMTRNYLSIYHDFCSRGVLVA